MLGFVAAVVVSALDKIGMRQLGLDGAIAEESRKVVRPARLCPTARSLHTVTINTVDMSTIFSKTQIIQDQMYTYMLLWFLCPKYSRLFIKL